MAVDFLKSLLFFLILAVVDFGTILFDKQLLLKKGLNFKVK